MRSSVPTLGTTGLLAALLLSGCPSPDVGAVPPEAGEDAGSIEGDLRVPDCLDCADPGPAADMAAPDLSAAADLGALHDLRAVHDLRVVHDLRPAHDLRPPPDLRAPADLRAPVPDLQAPVPDLRGPADLAAPPAGTVESRPGVSVSVTQLQNVLAGMELMNWDVVAQVQAPGTGEVPSPVGDCRLTRPNRTTGRTLEAGDLTIAGTPVGRVLLTYDPGSDAYDWEAIDDAFGEGTLFSETSQLRLSAAGGADIHSITQAGTWLGVKPLEYKSPKTLNSLPTSDFTLTWVAAPHAGVQMEVSLLSEDLRIDCPTSDSGSYTVKRQVISALPSGPVYVMVSRFAAAQASTSPDFGPVRLETRSSWQIITRK